MNEDLKDSQEIVLLVGSIDTEGIKSTIKASGRQYMLKHLNSSPNNWRSISSSFERFNVRSALLKLSGHLYEYFTDSEYEDVRKELFCSLSQVPHIVFVHEELFIESTTSEQTDVENDDSVYDTDYRFWPSFRPNEEVRKAVNKLLVEGGLNVIPYKSNAELTVMASSFIDEVEEGLLFRVYVPNGRMWSNEKDRLILLFRDYLTRVEQLSVRLDQHRTGRGIVYEFFDTSDYDNPNAVKNVVKHDSLAAQFREFSTLLDLSIHDLDAAEAFLKEKNIKPSEVVPLLTRYAKEAKRIHIDMKQEREQKVLGIRHRLESELVDVLPIDTTWDTINKLVDSTVPALSGMIASIDGGQVLQVSASSGSNVTVNLQPQIVHAVNSIVAQEIQGDVHLTEIDQKILQLIREYGSDKPELVSAVYELSDENVPQPKRLIAKQKLKAFLSVVGTKAGEIATGMLQTYIEKKLGIS